MARFRRIAPIALVCCLALVLGWGIATLGAGRVANVAFVPRTPTLVTGGAAAAPTVAETPSPAATEAIPPSPTARATAVPTPAATATPLAEFEAVRQRVAEIMAPLHTGRLDAVVVYGDGATAAAEAVFDLGDPEGPPRVHMTTRYQTKATTQRADRILIGERVWERAADGQWALLESPGHLLHEVQLLLPNAATIGPDATVRGDAEFRWYDASQDVDVVLRLDPATGQPREMQHSFRATGLKRTISYQNWNTAVSIAAPER